MKMGTPFPFLGTVPMNFSTPVFPFPKKRKTKGVLFLPAFPLFPQGIVGENEKKKFRNVRRHKFRERLLLLKFQTAEIYYFTKSRGHNFSLACEWDKAATLPSWAGAHHSKAKKPNQPTPHLFSLLPLQPFLFGATKDSYQRYVLKWRLGDGGK